MNFLRQLASRLTGGTERTSTVARERLQWMIQDQQRQRLVQNNVNQPPSATQNQILFNQQSQNNLNSTSTSKILQHHTATEQHVSQSNTNSASPQSQAEPKKTSKKAAAPSQTASGESGNKKSFDNNILNLKYVGPSTAAKLQAGGITTVDKIASLTPSEISKWKSTIPNIQRIKNQADLIVKQ